MTLKDRIAELLALDLPVTVIRTRLGLSNSTYYRLYKEICDDLGWQAQ